jgi:hypothetical protein
VCATLCTLAGSGAFAAVTAGVPITFTITALDEFGARRDQTTDSFAVRAFLPTDATADPFYATYTHVASGASPQDVNGTYVAALAVTRSGVFSLSVANGDAAGRGLLGVYFANPNWSGTTATRTEPTLDFNWGRIGPVPSAAFNASSFSARWSGFVMATASEVFTFSVLSDMGINLNVANRVLMAAAGTTSGVEVSATVNLVGGVMYDILVEYAELSPSSTPSLQIKWASASISKTTIPSSVLFPVIPPPTPI